MQDYNKAIKYLSKDKLSNCALLQVLKRNTANILKAEEDGVLLFDEVSNAYMLSAENTEKIFECLKGLENCYLFYVTDNCFVKYLQKLYNLDEILICKQFIYEDEHIVDYDKNLDIREPSSLDMDIIKKNYDKITDEELEEINKLHNLYVGYDKSKNMVGFIGSHLEGSMGILEVFPQYRRNGYASELERFMINDFIRKGMIPFCQVEVNNEKSIRLQRKLGLKESEKVVYWLSDNLEVKFKITDEIKEDK
ncbi:GNAT family N-acetyltransferase [Romboutsia sp. 1001713B170207_170306_H8]|uniref:GNAT family N-acetyltransferase n=1 Tax=Romboutsia sp. 1001713B170207_170306_H8 TaxID=2787112 RepID=UPI0008215DFC|nr:ribosomal-protein-alanine acetyltransferase [uncultured Clostridium sp.]